MKTKEELSKEMFSIMSQKNKLDKQINKLFNKIKKIEEGESQEVLLKIDLSNPEKMTQKQWDYVLHTDHNTSQKRHDATKSLLNVLNLSGYSFLKETNQVIIDIHGSYLENDRFDETLKSLKLISKKGKKSTSALNDGTNDIYHVSIIDKDCSYHDSYTLEIKGKKSRVVTRYSVFYDWLPLKNTLVRIKRELMD